MTRAFILAAALAAATPVLAQQQPAQPQTKVLGAFQAWGAYEATVGRGKTCYIHAAPAKSEGKYTSRDPTYIQVSHRPADKVTNEVSVTAGYTYKEGSTVEFDTGKQKFELFTKGDGAWAPKPEIDVAIVKAMAAGATLTVKGTSSRGTLTIDTYPLAGFSAALAEINKACGVK